MKKIFLAFLFLLSFTGFAQFSKTHYIPPFANSYYSPSPGFGNIQEVQDQYIYISCPSVKAVNFKITQIGGTIITGTVSRDKPYPYKIGNGPNTPLMIDEPNVGRVMKNKGYIVEADDMIYVTVRLTATKQDNNPPSQAGGLVSKGLAGLGTRFRIGAFTDKSITDDSGSVYTFATILATENNTKVSFADIKQGVKLVNNPSVGNTPPSIVLNQGESYAIAVQGPTNSNGTPNLANLDGLIGALITSDKNVVVNCGSFMGTNGSTSTKMDIGTDQIVSAERTGTKYIFIRGNGTDATEKPLIVADHDGTDVSLNGTFYKTLNAGEYLAIDGSKYSTNGNLYVETTENVFAYQGIGGSDSEANQNMHFVPPLRCETPKAINNIPFINKIGSDPSFIATVCVVTETGSDLTFLIDGTSYTLAQLKAKFPVNGPLAVTGNSNYVTYKIQNMMGNISVFSTSQVYVSYFGSSDNATYGGFYSGFTFNPEVSFGTVDGSSSGCLPNIQLAVNSISSFDYFQWYQNGNPITGANNNTYVPTAPGFYNVVGKITTCTSSSPLSSDKIPVSVCPADYDNDKVNDNIDIDIDNDGISNCTESLGNKNVDLTNVNAGNITQNPYSNSFTGMKTSSGTAATTPIVGKSDGSFVTSLLAGKTNSITQKWTFNKPISLSLNYPTTAAATDWLTANGDFTLEVPVDKTITVLNPDNQLLIDTNYDGVYESGITQFSSFQVRFRLNNGGQSLAPGAATFKFYAHLVNTFSITHANLSDTATDKATFVLTATCLPKDTDNDGVSDEFDIDDDNDGIPDKLEAVGKSNASAPFVDVNSDGMNDSYASLTLLDSDNDGINNYWDLDSDNDGIYDLIEAGHNAPDANLDGIIDGAPLAFGINGLYDALETSADSGNLNYTVADTNNDGNFNYISLDSDGDGCYDVIEAGFSDPDGDGYLGNSPVTVNVSGKVTTGTDGYTVPVNNNYIIAAPISITAQPTDQSVCETQNVSFTLTSNSDGYQWQVSTNGTIFTDIIDNATYSGSKTVVLKVINATANMSGYKYRVKLNKNGNSCNLTSDVAVLTVLALPKVTDPVTLVQCGDDANGSTNFNLEQIENQVSADYATQTFTFFTTLAAAQNNDPNYKINTPTVYKSADGMVWTRVENANGCFNVAQINLVVSVTQIPAGTVFKYYACDDNNDGISTFDFSAATNQIIALLPNNATYTVTYFKTEADALEETDDQGNSLAIPDPTQYQNEGYPNQENIWVRIDNSIPNSCVGLGPYVQLNVNPLPSIELTHDNVICKSDSYTSVDLNAGLLMGAQSQFTYQWYKNGTEITGEQGYYYTATSDGKYTCTVTDKTTGCQNTRTEKVVASQSATIENVEVVDLVDDDTVTITTTGTGIYEYAMDNPYGPFQDLNIFEHVQMGIHIVYVNDKNGCGMTSQTIAVIGAPNFFTPNGDGYNDVWKPKGVTSQFNTKTQVYIFDRFGKLLKQLATGGSEGWDGTFNSSPVPSDDYWYLMKLEDGREARGHFALKR